MAEKSEKCVVPANLLKKSVSEDTIDESFSTETVRLVGGERYMDCVHEELDQTDYAQLKLKTTEELVRGEQMKVVLAVPKLTTSQLTLTEDELEADEMEADDELEETKSVTLELVLRPSTRQDVVMDKKPVVAELEDSYSNALGQEDIDLTEYFSISESGGSDTQSDVLYNDVDTDSNLEEEKNDFFTDTSSSTTISSKVAAMVAKYNDNINNNNNNTLENNTAAKRQRSTQFLWKAATPKHSLATTTTTINNNKKRDNDSSYISDVSSTTILFSNIKNSAIDSSEASSTTVFNLIEKSKANDATFKRQRTSAAGGAGTGVGACRLFRQTGKPNRTLKTNFSAADIYRAAAKRAAEIASAAATLKQSISDTNLVVSERLKHFTQDGCIRRRPGCVTDDELERKLNAAFMQQVSTGVINVKPGMMCYERSRQLTVMRCSYLAVQQLTFQCPLADCHDRLGPTKLLQHYIMKHLAIGAAATAATAPTAAAAAAAAAKCFELREICADAKQTLIFESRNLNCRQHNCIEFFIYKGNENKYLTMVENVDLPEACTNMEYHLPLIILISKTSWNAVATAESKSIHSDSMQSVATTSTSSSSSSTNTSNNTNNSRSSSSNVFKNVALRVKQNVVTGLYVIWAFCPQTLKPLKLQITVADAERTEQRSAMIETRNTIEAKDFCDVFQKSKSFLRLTHGEIKLLSRNFTENLILEVTLHKQVASNQNN